MSEEGQTRDRDLPSRLALWQQGDFSFSCSEFVFLEPSEDGGQGGFDAAVDDSVEGFVVISQTCDIVRGPEKIPNVTVCPLVRVPAGTRSEIERKKQPRYGLVGNVDRDIVVDFSRAMSVRKELLVSWERQRGCGSDEELLEFARSLERFFGRFAFPDAFNDSVQPLRKAIYEKHEKQSDTGRAWRSIRELRVLPHADWNDKTSVPISFILVLEDKSKRPMPEIEKIMAELGEKFTAIEWVEPFSLASEGGVVPTTLADMTAADYLNSYPLDLNSLSYARRYR